MNATAAPGVAAAAAPSSTSPPVAASAYAVAGPRLVSPNNWRESDAVAPRPRHLASPPPPPASYARVPSSVLRICAWSDVPVSAAYFAVGFAVWFAHAVNGYTLAGVALHIAFLSLVVALLVAVRNALFDGVVPPPQVLVHPETLGEWGAAAAAGASVAVTRANQLLAWSDAAASLRWTATVWLAARAAPLLAPAVLLSAWIALFAVAPLYEAFGRPVDAAAFGRVLPALYVLQVRERAVRASAAAFYAENRLLAVGGGLAVLAAIAYILWGVVPLTTVATREQPQSRARRCLRLRELTPQSILTPLSFAQFSPS